MAVAIFFVQELHALILHSSLVVSLVHDLNTLSVDFGFELQVLCLLLVVELLGCRFFELKLLPVLHKASSEVFLILPIHFGLLI